MLTAIGCGGEPEQAPQQAVWDADSQRVDVSCGQEESGSTRFAADRAQLSATQLALLANLRVVDASSQCGADAESCRISVLQRNGTSASFDAVSGDFTCGAGRRMVSFASLAPFLATLPCRHSKDPVTGTAAEVPRPPDARCWNGLFVGAFFDTNGTNTVTVPLSFPDATSTYQLELDQCASPNRVGKIHMQLLAPGTAGPVAVGKSVADPGPDQTCERLTATVPQPGTYSLSVVVDDGFLPLGDLFFRFY